MVMFTRWYFIPRESGGDCHHFSVPSIAYRTGCAYFTLYGSHLSQASPLMGVPDVTETVASLQYNSLRFTPSPTPQVDVATIFFPWAIFINEGRSPCPLQTLTCQINANRRGIAKITPCMVHTAPVAHINTRAAQFYSLLSKEALMFKYWKYAKTTCLAQGVKGSDVNI